MERSRVMNKIHLFFDKLWQRGVPVSFVALTLLLATITVLVVGSGLHSAAIWLILATVSILFVTLCNCLKCKKRASRWRRGSHQSDSISTTMEGSEFPNMPSSLGRSRESITLSSDLPPCYTLATFPDRQPPPPYAVAASPLRAHGHADDIFMPPAYSSIVTDPDTVSCYQCEDLTMPPPPYNSIDASPVATHNRTVSLGTRGQRGSNTDSISIIANSDMTSVSKNVNEVIQCQA